MDELTRRKLKVAIAAYYGEEETSDEKLDQTIANLDQNGDLLFRYIVSAIRDGASAQSLAYDGKTIKHIASILDFQFSDDEEGS